MGTPGRPAVTRSRVETSLGELRELILVARRINALAAQHGVAVDEARRLAEDELGARAAAEQPAGGVVPPPRLTTEKRHYPEPGQTAAAYASRRGPRADDAPLASAHPADRRSAP